MTEIKVYSVKQVAKILGTGYNTVLALIHSKQLRAFRMGRNWKVTEPALLEYMDLVTQPVSATLPDLVDLAENVISAPEPKPEPELNNGHFSNGHYPIEQGFKFTKGKSGGKKPELYPFSKMNAWDSFFVAETDIRPRPWERFASTVSSANRRLAPKRFVIQKIIKGTTNGGPVEPLNGARIFRIQ